MGEPFQKRVENNEYSLTWYMDWMACLNPDNYFAGNIVKSEMC